MVVASRPSTRVQYIPDDLWASLAALLAEHDPAWPRDAQHTGTVKLTGPRRTDSRQVLEAILYHEETGCGWNKLPDFFPDDLVVHRRWRYWQRIGLLDQLYQTTLDYYVAHGWVRARTEDDHWKELPRRGVRPCLP